MNFKEIDLFEQSGRLWEWVIGIQHWNSLEGWLARIACWVVVVAVLLAVLRFMLEMIAKIVDCWKNLGLPLTNSKTDTAHRRRRQQFCKVLESDLATIAKAENWNDQFFTDLEAEVETDGSYYANSVDRLLRRKSRGLRRVSSLIQAIESSAEQCLLLTGNPGSGKSVALRHLASQLAEKGTRSKSRAAKIPLYLNLKELPSAPTEGPSADFIKEFVLENIRRGDADTAAYVRENWNQNREQGLWYFLFDSFDEIPAVLHAPTGSLVINKHAEAIRKFFEGMSDCQGVLASREYKGPDALPWIRLRILPLSPSRQEELIENSFLLTQQKTIAVQHVAASGTGFLTNPLFLTLLCRFVKDENKPPANDNELLLKHIHHLANRESDYIQKKYGLSPEQIINGSINLSVLFAEQASLSLAPTLKQISQHYCDSSTGVLLENLIGALLDVKIGRCDVKESRAGDRRFTFSHRRYQETLFVQYLIVNPTYLSPNALLTNSRWRDYTVTLLQTSSSQVVDPLLHEAGRLFREFLNESRSVQIDSTYGAKLCYFIWENSLGTQLLLLLQDGLSRRLEIVPETLRLDVKGYLNSAWNEGDSYDRLMVIVLGGLLPNTDLTDKIDWAVRSGTLYHLDAAVMSSFFLTIVPEEMAIWFRTELANRLLLVNSRADAFKMEAIAARSPLNVGASFIIDRARKIRRISKFARAVVPRNLSVIEQDYLRPRGDSRFERRLFGFMQYYLFMIPGLFIAIAYELVDRNLFASSIALAICLLSLISIIKHLWLFEFRAVGGPLSFSRVLVEIKSRWNRRSGNVSSSLMAFIVMIGICGICGGLLHLIAYLLKFNKSIYLLYIAGGPIVFCLSMMSYIIISENRKRSASSVRLGIEFARKNNRFATLLRADSWADIENWIKEKRLELIPTIVDARSFLRFVDAVGNGERPCGDETKLEKDCLSDSTLKRIQRLIIGRVLELEKTQSGIQTLE